MKNIFLFFAIILFYNCSAQNQIVNITDKDGTRVTDTYYKDENNLLDPYEGNWLYTNGTTSFKMVLVKKIQQYNGRYYEDLIIGEYQYIENGIEKMNTLNDLQTVYDNQRRHKIDGNTIIKKGNKPPCETCGVNEKRLRLSFSDQINNIYGELVARRITYNGQIALHIRLRAEGGYQPWFDGQPQPPNDFTIPAGEYILIKQ